MEKKPNALKKAGFQPLKDQDINLKICLLEQLPELVVGSRRLSLICISLPFLFQISAFIFESAKSIAPDILANDEPII